ncbi:MAG: glucose-1-phosphate adenylyltransferase family protein [Candidatus Eisenbacteria bacterium]
MRNSITLVLSGGGGERLGVLTAERAVSAVPFGGKYRVIDFVLSNCCHSGCVPIGVLTQHAPTSLHDHIGAGRPWDLDRRGGGVMILQPYLTRSHAGWYRGTADAIAQNWDYIEERRPDRVLVLSGDHVYQMDYRALFATHADRGAAATIAVTRVPADQTRRFGMATLDREGRVTALVEKPERAETPFASMGIYLFEREVLSELLKSNPVDMVLDVLRPMLDAGRKVTAHEFEGYWEDVGTVGSYYRANLELVAATPRLVLDDQRWPILTRDEERPPVHFGEGAEVVDSLVANGCRVRGRVVRSVLSPGVTVEPGAEVVESVVMSDVVIERGARVRHAVIDKYVRVGANAQIGEGERTAAGEHDWLEGLTLIGKDATIPAGLRVGRAAVVGVGVKPDAFAGDCVDAGTVVASRAWHEEMR